MFEYYDINLYDKKAKRLVLKSKRINIFILLGGIIFYLFFLLPLFLTSMLDETYRISIFYFIVLVIGEMAISCFFFGFIYIYLITSKVEIDVLQNKTIFIKYFAFIMIKKIRKKTVFRKVILTEDLTTYIDNEYKAAGSFSTFGIKILSKSSQIPDVILINFQKDREKTKQARDMLANILQLPTGFKRLVETGNQNEKKMDYRLSKDNVVYVITDKMR